jgi:hypothetical protein
MVLLKCRIEPCWGRIVLPYVLLGVCANLFILEIIHQKLDSLFTITVDKLLR